MASLHPKWHHIPFIVHYFYPGHLRDRVALGMQARYGRELIFMGRIYSTFTNIIYRKETYEHHKPCGGPR